MAHQCVNLIHKSKYLKHFVWSVALVGSLIATNVMAAEVNVYSARKEALILPLLEKFTSDTGIKVNLLTGKSDALLTRLAQEGKNTPADIVIAVDVARLHRAKQQNLTQTLHSDYLKAVIPKHWRDPDNQWYALTSRARPIMYAKDRVNASELSRYEDLADSDWRGRLCMRSSNNVYNQSLVASKLLADGKDQTITWINGLVSNFARPPAGGDTDQIKAVAAGQCDVTMANTYYLGRLASSFKASDRAVAKKIGVFWPNQQDRGAHFNVSGIAMTRYASNKNEAQQLAEYLLSPSSQTWYAKQNNEYPVVEGVDIADALVEFGTGKADTAHLFRLGELNTEAVKIMDAAGWK